MITLVKTGGKILEEETLLKQQLQSFVQLEGPKLLVHGGGKRATDLAEKLGVETLMVKGRRITSPAMLEVVLMVFGGLMNRTLVAKLQALGQQALGLTGADLDLIRAEKRPVKDIDYGMVGDIVSVQAEELLLLLERGIVPVIAPLTHDKQGQIYNTNADTVAATVAMALAESRATRLILSFEMPGVLLDPQDPASLLPELDEADFQAYQASGAIVGGMIPKLSNAFAALKAGVAEVFICHANQLHRVGTDDFVGTKVVLVRSDLIA
jgi:acetylglutamate kinase